VNFKKKENMNNKNLNIDAKGKYHLGFPGVENNDFNYILFLRDENFLESKAGLFIYDKKAKLKIFSQTVFNKIGNVCDKIS